MAAYAGTGIDPVGNSSAAWMAAVDRKHELIFNATLLHLPHAEQNWYGRGASSMYVCVCGVGGVHGSSADTRYSDASTSVTLPPPQSLH
jgi:hypothetical protein